MEILLAMVLPIALLWVGFAVVSGRSLAPSAVMRSVVSMLWRTLRWLWKERPQQSGAGRLRLPRVRYRQ